MPSTTNFGWTTPADTDLVKDGASAIRTLGNGIDTSFVDLKGGTTGQVLAKATNADLDFTWTDGGDITAVTAGTGISGGGTSGAVTITNSMATAITTNGDIIYGTGSGTFTRLGIGSTGNVLTVAGGVPSWAAPSSNAKFGQAVFAEITSSTSSTSTTFVDATNFNASITPTNASSKVLVIVNACMGGVYLGDNSGQFDIQLVRGTTSVFAPNRNNWWETSGTSTTKNFRSTVPLTYLDSPATTSSTTYKIQIRNQFGGSVYVNNDSNRSTILLIEVLP